MVGFGPADLGSNPSRATFILQVVQKKTGMDGCTKQTVDQPEQHRIDIAAAYPDPPVQSPGLISQHTCYAKQENTQPQNPTVRESKKPAPAIPISTTIPMPPRLSPEPSPAAPHRKELKPNPVTLATRRARPVRSRLPEKNPLTKPSRTLFGSSNCSTPACMSTRTHLHSGGKRILRNRRRVQSLARSGGRESRPYEKHGISRHVPSPEAVQMNTHLHERFVFAFGYR